MDLMKSFSIPLKHCTVFHGDDPVSYFSNNQTYDKVITFQPIRNPPLLRYEPINELNQIRICGPLMGVLKELSLREKSR